MNRRTAAAIGAAVLGFAVLWIYFPAIRGDWIWDDQVEVPENALLRDPAGIPKLWFAPATTDYFPLKSTVQWLEWHAWGPNVLGYHLANVLLHLASALLLWRLLAKLGVRLAFLGGAIFAVYPLAVESVAWISELKNTLSLPPLILAAICYVDFERNRRPAGYGAALAWFAAALLCKTSVVMFPCLLLLYAAWSRGRVSVRDLRAAAPFFALSLALGLVTIWFQEHRALSGEPVALGGPAARLETAVVAFSFYVWKCVWPAGLVPVYPRWSPGALGPAQILPCAGVAILAAAAWIGRAGWGRAVLFAFGAIALCLLPVLGFLPMAFQRISWVSDHLAYLAVAAFSGFAAALISRAWEALRPGRRGKAALCAGLAAILALLAAESRAYASVYTGDRAFWGFTLRHNPHSWMAENDLGMAVQKSGHPAEALALFTGALRDKPDYDAAYVNLGNALVQLGRPADAIGPYRGALRLKPAYADAHVYLGFALAADGRTPEAIDEYREAIRLKPDDAVAQLYLGTALAKTGRGEEAAACYREAARLDPRSAEARYDLANLAGNAGRMGEAIGLYEDALKIDPSHAAAHANLGLAFANLGRFDEAIAQLREALRLKPDYPEAHAYLGFALNGAGRPGDAIPEYEAALRSDPRDADLRYNLAVALRAAGRPAEAAEQLERARRLRGMP